MGVASGNEQAGIQFSNAAGMASDNAIYSNDGDGIEDLASDLHVQGNVLRGNGAFGLDLSIGSTYLENTITGNTGGTATGGLDMGANSCNGNSTCP